MSTVESRPDGKDPKFNASHLLQYFEYAHLPDHLQVVSKVFPELAWYIDAVIPPGPEKTVAFRKLLESKDCAVRAALPTEPQETTQSSS